MKKVITLGQAERIANQLRLQGKSIVLAGGCFDIIHEGHLTYLQNAKKEGDVLFVALENDKNVRRLKGKGKPVNGAKERANALAALDMVDYVILLPLLKTDDEYFNFTQSLSPHVIAITKGDPKQKQKERQAKDVGGKVIIVTKYLEDYSTTALLKAK